MFLIDKIFTAPFCGIYKIFEEVHAAVQQEQKNSIEAVMQELMALYRSLETGALSEVEFEQQEKLLLDKLDQLKRDQI